MPEGEGPAPAVPVQRLHEVGDVRTPHTRTSGSSPQPVIPPSLDCPEHHSFAPFACLSPPLRARSAKVKKASLALEHKEAFKKAAANWATSKDNPKNK